MKKVSIDDMTSEEIGEAIDRALKEVAAEYEAGTLDMSGRYYTDEELEEMRALGTSSVPKRTETAA